MNQDEYFNKIKEKAKAIYSVQKEIYNPYFKTNIILNSDGFHHLQFSARRERDKREQIFKFDLLPFGLEIIRKSGTIQEYKIIFVLERDVVFQNKKGKPKTFYRRHRR